jgi:hypothetical protein
MRVLNEFIIPKEEEVQETETSKNEKGEEITTTKTVKKTVDKTFIVKKPTRAFYDEAELFYGVKLSEGIKAGLLTRALLAKRFNNDGGILSDPEKEKFSKLYMSLFEKQAKLAEIENKPKRERTKSEETEMEILVEELKASREQIQEFEMSQASLFDQTAENRARNKTILWWVLNLAFQKTGEDEYEEVFKGENHEEKLAQYDRYEEMEDDFIDEMLKKFSYVVSFWYITKADTKEELDVLLSSSEKLDEEEASETNEEQSEPEPAPEPEPEPAPEPEPEPAPEPEPEPAPEPEPEPAPEPEPEPVPEPVPEQSQEESEKETEKNSEQ